ncbi:glycosyltransferase family 2 protein [uncultured Aliiroseovarius sp.]|uniref:glycosyltransferase family 2 protein n=1 Tax=uncultured Aliiroseovarius sp. TaxID=1658783 RepID=UPI00261ECC2B|nr:glycosyltransferase family 2 protein [uncultured Aliiroseovarius sp.]
MRNEAQFILEWVAYHRMIGINDPIVFSNACTDGTDLMLERLDEMGLIRHLPNPTMMTGGRMHIIAALRYLNTGNRLARSDWVVSMDVDEFINIKVGNGHLEDLFDAVPDANLISLSQQNFGHGGKFDYVDDLQISQFEYGWDLERSYTRNLNRRGTKTLTHQSSRPTSWGNHSPVFAADQLEYLRPVNGSGEDISHVNMTNTVKALITPNYGFGLVQLNHYAVRSIDSYLLKVARGSSAHPDRPYEMTYWRKYDHNDHHDQSIMRHADDLETAKKDLLRDPELKQLHMAAVENAHGLIAELKESEQVRSLLNRIRRYTRRNPGLLAAPKEATPAAE